jgi:hypothetical protein
LGDFDIPVLVVTKYMRKEFGDVDWIYLAQGRVYLWALTNIVMNLSVPIRIGVVLN